jgi:hypothetical protein
VQILRASPAGLLAPCIELRAIGVEHRSFVLRSSARQLQNWPDFARQAGERRASFPARRLFSIVQN